MRRLLLIGCLTAACAASPALAQSRASAQSGLRYLSWPGKAAAPQSQAPRPNQRPAVRTPARSAPAPLPAPAPAPVVVQRAPAPSPVVQAAYQPPAQPAPVRQQPDPAPAVDPRDPNAPRADALIQRLAAHRRAAETAAQSQAQAPAPAAPAAAAPQAAPAANAQNAQAVAGPQSGQQPASYNVVPGARRPVAAERPRYYSLHRDSGRTPDPLPLAAGFFQPTADLAEPPPVPQTQTQMRAAAAGVSLESDAQP